MNESESIQELSINRRVFKKLLSAVPEAISVWKPMPEMRYLFEIVCRIYDYEREDFKIRTKQVLGYPASPLNPTYLKGWVETRNS